MAGYRDPIKGETLTGYLRDVLEGLVRRIHGEGVATSPDGTDVSISHEEGGGAEAISSTTYFALITQSKGMILPDHIQGRGVIAHEYRFVYAFREVDLVMICFDSSGNTVPPDECTPGTPQYPYYEEPQKENHLIRKGVLTWPESGLRYPWAINLAEVLHKTELSRSFTAGSSGEGFEPLMIYGADVMANTYPPYFQPLGIGQGPGDPPDRRAYQQIVEMHETTDSNGRLIRWFDNPGLHHGACKA